MPPLKHFSATDITSNKEVKGNQFFFISFLLLAIPLFYLSYEFNKANNEEIVFAEDENRGLSSLLEQDGLYINQRNDFVEHVFGDEAAKFQEHYEKFKANRDTILDDSNLILDPQKETYHLIVVSQKESYDIEKEVLDMYGFYSKGVDNRLGDISFSSGLVQNNISDAILSYKKFCSADCPPHFKLGYEKYESSLLEVVHSLGQRSASDLQDRNAIVNQIKQFLQASDALRLQSNSLISKKLKERIDKYDFQRKSVLAATFVLWLASLICSYIFYSINLRKIKDYIFQIQNQNEELERVKKLSLLGELAAGIGHEINNPLSIAAISLELINAKLDAGDSGVGQRDEIRALLVRIDKMILNIKQIIRSFKSFAFSGDEEKISYISLKEAVGDSLVLIQYKSLEQNVEIQNLISTDLKVFGTLHGLVQVLVNLFNNAIDAMENHSHKKWIKIEATVKDEYVFIDVSDNGPGVPSHIREKIFNPLFTTKNSSKGTGLGLGLAKKICLKYGGDLSLVESPQGAKFQIKLKVT